MPINKYFDSNVFRRLDNSNIVDFLTSTSGILAEGGYLSAKEIDGLRIVLTGIQSHQESREEPVLEQLLGQKADILTVLTSRFGPQGFSLNLFRHTVRNRLFETVSILREWQSLFLKKVDLYFNRQINIYFDQVFEKTVLLSTVLVELIEQVNGSIEQLEKIIAEFSQMLPSGLEGSDEKDREVDERIAGTLGFKAVSDQLPSAERERKIKRELACVFQDLSDYTGRFMKRLVQNSSIKMNQGNGQKGTEITMLCELIGLESQKMASLNFPDTSSLEIWELRRQNIISAIAGVNSLIKCLLESVTSEVGTNDNIKSSGQDSFSESLQRRLIFDLISSGVSAKEADLAVTTFKQYVIKNNTYPEKILLAELIKINPVLSQRTFDLLRKLTSEDYVTKRSLTEKKNIIIRSERLKKILAEFCSKVILLFGFIAVQLMGCGLKTMPKNDFIDPRPDIPFYEETPSVIDKNEINKLPLPPSQMQKKDDGKTQTK